MDDLFIMARKLHLEGGKTIKETAQTLGCSEWAVKRFCSRRYDEVIERKKSKEMAEKAFEEAVKKNLPISNSLNHLCANLGLRGVSGYYKKVKGVIGKYGFDTSHFGTLGTPTSSGRRNKFTKMSDEEFFVDGTKRDGNDIIKRLIDGGYKEYRCEKCGISTWQGMPLRLQVHHINGRHIDNTLGNIQLLCPNCHAQTDTYGRKNKK